MSRLRGQVFLVIRKGTTWKSPLSIPRMRRYRPKLRAGERTVLVTIDVDDRFFDDDVGHVHVTVGRGGVTVEKREG